MDGDAPAVLLRDRDNKFGLAFDRAAQGVGAKVIRTAVRTSNMNAVAERFVASVRRELLDHVLLVDDQHLACLLRRYQCYFNESRPHQGLNQRIPAGPVTPLNPSKPIAVTSVLGGLHVDYRRAA
jgi:transposase InsO family protein